MLHPTLVERFKYNYGRIFWDFLKIILPQPSFCHNTLSELAEFFRLLSQAVYLKLENNFKQSINKEELDLFAFSIIIC
ncbi:MAG: hypothetical protein QNJ54_09545 [Prochloraceae cyanobacterium]|nr:hypothetical protein [Prochloraceae cyanobacterium]